MEEFHAVDRRSPEAGFGRRLFLTNKRERSAARAHPSFIAILVAVSLPCIGHARANPADAPDAQALIETIMTQVASSLPNAAPRKVEAERRRVRIFAGILQEFCYPAADPAAVRAAAVAAIDAAVKAEATPDSLVHAALLGVSSFVSTGALPGSSAATRARSANASAVIGGRRVGSLWVVTLPTLLFPEPQGECPALRHYFDFPPDGVSAVVLDIRGNQGGYMPTLACVASQFVAPLTPLILLRDRVRSKSLDSVATGRSAPIAEPLAILLDAETDSGGLAIAMALQDAGRAVLVGEATEHMNDKVCNVIPMTGRKEWFSIPIGTMNHLDGNPRGAGVRIDVAVTTRDEKPLLAAACAHLNGCREQQAESAPATQNAP